MLHRARVGCTVCCSSCCGYMVNTLCGQVITFSSVLTGILTNIHLIWTHFSRNRDNFKHAWLFQYFCKSDLQMVDNFLIFQLTLKKRVWQFKLDTYSCSKHWTEILRFSSVFPCTLRLPNLSRPATSDCFSYLFFSYMFIKGHNKLNLELAFLFVRKRWEVEKC